MLIKSKAIVLKTIRYSESDLIVKLYTQDRGILSFILKGVLKSKKGKIRASFFQIGNQLEIDYIYRTRSNLQHLKEVKISSHYRDLSTNIFKSSVLTFVLEVFHNVLPDEDQDVPCFIFLEQSLLWLDNSEDYLLFHHYFLLQLTHYLGCFPTKEAYDYSHVYSTIDFSMFEPYLDLELASLNTLKVPKSERELLLEKILSYYKLHLPDFKEPKSLLVFKQLFS